MKLPIVITDEIGDETVTATALLDLASGDITHIVYQGGYDADADGAPYDHEDYDFSSGKLSNAGKDVEFSVQTNVGRSAYSVSTDELLEIKKRAAALFTGAYADGLAHEVVGTKSLTKGLRASARR